MSQAISFRRKDAAGQAIPASNNSFKVSDLAVSPKWRSSPMSFKMGSLVGSLGTRLYPAPGCSPTPALDPQDFKMGSVSSSFDHTRFIQALSTSHTNDDGCSNYTCCGLPLTDLHALLDHFEESHVYVLDHHTLAPAVATAAPAAALPVPGHFEDMTLGGMEMDHHHTHHHITDIDLDSTDSPLGSGSSTASSQNSSPTMGSQAALSTNASIYPYYADLRSLMASAAATGVPTSMAPNGIVPGDSNLSAQLQQQQTQCIPPSLLFSPAGSPGPSRPQSSAGIAPSATTTPTSPTPGSALPAVPAEKSAAAEAASTSASSPTKIKSTPEALAGAIDETLVVSGPNIIHPGPPPPTAAPTSLSKPFKCPTPHCNKSYKQANGLKYHLTHGQCCFLPKDPALEGLDELEKDKVERPFGCGVGGCERRYKNMNGLRYHYQHSGAHGAVGLALLAAGTHSVQIAAHNAAVGRSSAKQQLQRAQSQASSSSSQPTSPRSPGAGGPSNLARQGHGGHSRSSSISSTMSSMSGMSTNTVRGPSIPTTSTPGSRPSVGPTSPVRANVAASRPVPGQPHAPTYAQSTYYSQQQYQQQQQQPGYPYLPPPSHPAGYPYLPSQQQQPYPAPNGTNAANRGPVFPPSSISGTIAAMAGAFGHNTNATVTSPTAAGSAVGAPFNYQQPQRPHQLLRANSHGQPGAPVVATSAVTAVGGGSPHTEDANMEMDVDEGDFRMQE